MAVIGVGHTRVGAQPEATLRHLFADAANEALEDAGVDKVDAIVVGNMMSGRLQCQESLGTLSATSIGMTGISVMKVEGACASGGVAVHAGFNSVRAGVYDIVLVAGIEKMSGMSISEVTSGLMMAEDRDYVAASGVTFVGLNAMVARYYMDRLKVRHEDIAQFPVVCHKHGFNNPKAQFRKLITVDDVMSSPLVADPLHLYECSGIGDGGAAVVLSSTKIAKKLTDTPIEIVGSSIANDSISLHQRLDLTTFPASKTSAKKAFDMAKLQPKDIDVLEVHDAFSILGVMALEDLGFAEKGEGAKLVTEGQIEIGGRLPTNTFGGLKSRGHPVGASGVYQIVELTQQLRNQAGKNQVPAAQYGYAQSIGGIGSTITGHILARAD